jgi:hypothetical protein
MAVTVSRLEAVLRADTRQFDSSMDKSEGRMHSIGKVAGVAGLAIAGGLAVGLEKSVKAAMDAQTSQARLAQAFANAHLSAAKFEPQVKTLEAASRKLGFTEEDVHTSLGSLITATHSMTKASSDLSVAQDIARFKGVGLTDATKMLTMAMTGSQRATKQLGINVSPVTITMENLKKATEDQITAQHKGMTAAQDHSAALAFFRTALGQTEMAQAKLTDKQLTGDAVIKAVSEHLHGQADAYSKTAAGGMEAVKAQLNYLEISMGTALLPILAKVAGALATATEYFSKHATVTRIVIAATASLGAAMLLTAGYVKLTSSALVEKLIPALAKSTAAMLGFDTAADANPIGAVTVAVVALAAALVVLQVKYQGVTRTIDFLREHFYLLMAVPVIGWSLALSVAILNNWGKIVSATSHLVDVFRSLPGMIGDGIAGSIGVLKAKLEDIFDWHRIVKWIKKALGFGSPSPYFMAIGHDMVDSMIRGVGGAAGLLKDAVVRMAKDVALGPLHAAGSAAGAVLGGGGVKAGSSTGNVALARGMAYSQHNWRGAEWTALYNLWNAESGFSNTIWGSGVHSTAGLGGREAAYGIAQAKPAGKMPKAGTAEGGSDPGTQIRWGLDYIRKRYHDPLGALAHERSFGWYDRGGWLPQGLSLALNTTGRPERVGGGGHTYNVTNIFPGYVGDESVVAAVVRDALESFQNRNGRPAYGSGF